MFIIKRRLSTFLQLAENSKSIQNACRVFAEKELKPAASQHDKLAKFPQKQIEQLARDGFMGACIDPKYGGKGLNLLTFTLVIEELSRCCASTGIIVSIHNCLYADLVQSFGTPEQIDEFLVPYTKGNIGVFALSEHDAGSDAANLSTTANKTDSGYVLNGRKAWVTSACEAKAGVFFAHTDKSKGHAGISAFLVPFDIAGVEIGPREEKLGIRATSTCDINLNNVHLPETSVIGGIGNGFKVAMRQLQLGRIGVASQALGIGQSKLAQMALNLESSRLLVRKAAALRDANEDFRKLSSMAKYSASRCATSNANNCVQILGAKGFVSGDAERYYRDSRITQIYGGPSDIQKMVIADLLLKE